MATLVPHYFNKYELSEQEEQLAYEGISELTLMMLQNRVADLFEDKAALLLDPEHPQKFVQAEAELRGSINVLLDIINICKQR